jgi:hypothetical protein
MTMKKYCFALLLALACSFPCFAQDKSKEEKPKEEKIRIEDDQTFLVLSTLKIQTMEKELDEAASKGFRVLYGAPTASFDMALFLRRLDKAEAAPYSYKILATSRLKTMEKELNDIAALGYRLLPRTIIFKQGLFTAELTMIMERAPNPATNYEYKLVFAGKETKLHKKIDEAIALGFQPSTMITLGANVVVMEKEVPVKTPVNF